MRNSTIATLFGIALLFHTVPSLGAEAATPPVASPQQRADACVLKHSSAILGIPVGQLRVGQAYAEQVGGGDALNVFEIAMAVEEDLGIAIDDMAIYRAAGTESVDRLAQQLSIAEFQAVVRDALTAAAD